MLVLFAVLKPFGFTCVPCFMLMMKLLIVLEMMVVGVMMTMVHCD